MTTSSLRGPATYKVNPEYIGASVDVGGYLVGDPSFREGRISCWRKCMGQKLDQVMEQIASSANASDSAVLQFASLAGRIFEEYIMPLTKEVHSARKHPKNA